MRNLTFKAAMLKDSRTTVNRQSTDGQSQRHCKQTPLSKRWKVLMTLVFLFTFAIGQMWGAWSMADKPTSTLTCSASASTGITKSYNFHSDATNSDTIVFSAYDAYNASVTWGTKTSGDITNTSKSWNPIIYRSASNNASAGNSVYTGGGQMLTKFRPARKVRFLVTNCTGAMISGFVGSSKSLTLNAYQYSGGTISSTAAVTGSTITNTSIASASISGLSAENTYVIEIAGGAEDNNQHLAEVAFIYPHASAGDNPGDEPGDDPDPGCTTPTNATITANPANAEYTAGDNISLTASAENATSATFTWYKGTDWATASAGSSVGTGATFSKNSCTTDDEGTYWCNISNGTGCEVQVSKAITVAADTKCFNMPAITSKPSDLAHVTVTGGTLSDASVNGKAIAFKSTGLGLGGGNDARLKVTLTGASIVEGTKITINYNDASTDGNGSGLAIYDGDHNNKTLNSTGLKNSGSVSHTFTAEEAANYDDEFIIDRNQTGKGIIMGSITVEDCGPAVTKHTITLNYNDGVTPNGSIKVVDGKTAAAKKPTDPTRGKYTFLGWFVGDTDNEYVWSTAVTGDITLKAHWQDPWTITFDEDGGSEVADITVKHNTKAEKPADPTKENHDFNGWYYGNPEVAFNWDANVTQDYSLKAHWLELVTKYDIEYYDGETKIGTEEQVRVDQHPTAAGISTDKPLYSFVGWYTSSTLEGDPVALNTVTPVEGLKLYGKWNKAYAADIDFEAFIDANGTSGDWGAELADKHYAISSTTGVTLDAPNGKPADKGLKIKNSGSYLSFNVHAGKLVLLKAGVLSGAEASVDGGAHYATLTGATGSTAASVVTPLYNAAEAEYRIRTTTGSYNIIQSITIQDPYQVTFDANGGEDVASLNGTPSVTLPSATKGTDSFLGWFDAAEGGNKIGEAGASYTPTADIELFAHWEAVSTDARLASITFSATGTLSPAFDPEVTSYTYTMPYGTAAIPTITGATSVNAKAQEPVIVQQAAAWNETAIIRGKAQSGDTKAYNVTMKMAPKDGVVIIHADIPSGTSADYAATGLYAGTGNSKNEGSSLKLGANHYAGVNLSGSEIFKEGDILNIHVKTKNGFVKAPISTTNAVDGSGVIFTEERSFVVGDNFITLTSAFEEANSSSLYLVRTTAIDAECNPAVDYIEVTRAMNPVLTAISFNGVAATKGTGNAFSVTLPEAGTNLASLTIVPTIIRNAAHATTPQAVVSNGGAWKEGANTYRVMDKDGDYTDYTITITLQGSAETPVINAQPAGSAYCAGSEPTLTVGVNEVSDGGTLSYQWYKAGETPEAVGENAASYTVASAGTYYVIITNHVDGKLDKSVTSENAVVTLNVAAAITKQPTNKRDIALNSEVTLSVEATNATSYQWYICDDAEKHNASAISGAEAANYVFNCTANAYYYCVVGNACGADLESNVVSVKLEPEGCNLIGTPSGNAYTQAGEWSIYPVNSNGQHDPEGADFGTCKAFDEETDVNCVNTRRFAIKFEKDVESVTIYARGGTGRTFDKVSVADEMAKNAYTELTDITKQLITIDGAGKEYIATAEGVIPGGKYAWFDFSGSFSGVFKICYTAALVEPKLPTLADQELCAGAAYETFDATITNAAACEGTVSYKWYETTDTENPVAETATFTPSTDGTYYVVVTHSAAGHMTRVAQSAELTVAHFAAPALVSYSENVFQHMGTAAELSVVATGSGLAYAWYTCDVDGGNAEVISGAEEATYAIASIAEGVQYYKVVISNNCDESTLSHIFKVEGWDQLEQVDVTASTVWDMTNVSASEINLKDDYTPSKQNERLLLANIEGVNNNASFNSQALYFEGQRIGRTENNVKYVSGQYVQFNVTVPGMVSVTFASNGDAQRTIQINGKECSRTTTSSDYIRYDVAVEPGSVEIEDVQGYVRISKIEFKAEDSYHRTVNPSFLGTLCWTNNAILGGAKLYEFQGRDAHNYLVFDEVLENRLEAGKPYIFMPENGNTEIKVYNTDDAQPLDEDQDPVNNMYGTITGTILSHNNEHMYYFSTNHIWRVADFTVDVEIPAYYCYVDYLAVLEGPLAPVNPAPGRRRVTMGVQGEQIATGIENLNASDKPMKLMINGQIFILRGEKLFDATGRLVK